jgi:hypothetical protein
VKGLWRAARHEPTVVIQHNDVIGWDHHGELAPRRSPKIHILPAPFTIDESIPGNFLKNSLGRARTGGL